MIMDEETADSVSVQSGNIIPEIKVKKKNVTAKKKADKEAVPAKKSDKAAASAGKTDNEAEPVKKAKKVAIPAKNANNEAEAVIKVYKEAKIMKREDTEVGPPKEKKKSTLDLICEAIELLGEGKKGASVQAIKRYVQSKNDSAASSGRINTLVNKALTKGLEKGRLVRPTASKDATGAVGFFRLAKTEIPKSISKTAKKQKIDSEHASDSETIEKPAKPRKRNLSDTYIADMKGSLTSTPKPSKQATVSKDKQTKKISKKDVNDKKDTSDSKIVMKKTKRKSMKSYSSDTEVDLKKSKNTKTAKEPLKKTASDKPKNSKANSPSKVSKSKVKKLYSSAEGKGAKSEKTKAKKP